jgi:hypothetical protein
MNQIYLNWGHLNTDACFLSEDLANSRMTWRRSSFSLSAPAKLSLRYDTFSHAQPELLFDFGNYELQRLAVVVGGAFLFVFFACTLCCTCIAVWSHSSQLCLLYRKRCTPKRRVSDLLVCRFLFVAIQFTVFVLAICGLAAYRSEPVLVPLGCQLVDGFSALTLGVSDASVGWSGFQRLHDAVAAFENSAAQLEVYMRNFDQLKLLETYVNVSKDLVDKYRLAHAATLVGPAETLLEAVVDYAEAESKNVDYAFQQLATSILNSSTHFTADFQAAYASLKPFSRSNIQALEAFMRRFLITEMAQRES